MKIFGNFQSDLVSFCLKLFYYELLHMPNCRLVKTKKERKQMGLNGNEETTVKQAGVESDGLRSPQNDNIPKS